MWKMDCKISNKRFRPFCALCDRRRRCQDHVEAKKFVGIDRKLPESLDSAQHFDPR